MVSSHWNKSSFKTFFKRIAYPSFGTKACFSGEATLKGDTHQAFPSGSYWTVLKQRRNQRLVIRRASAFSAIYNHNLVTGMVCSFMKFHSTIKSQARSSVKRIKVTSVRPTPSIPSYMIVAVSLCFVKF